MLVFGLSRYGSACCFVVEPIVSGFFVCSLLFVVVLPAFPCLADILLDVVELSMIWVSSSRAMGWPAVCGRGMILSYPLFCQISHGVSSSGLNGGCSQVTILNNIAKVRK